MLLQRPCESATLDSRPSGAATPETLRPPKSSKGLPSCPAAGEVDFVEDLSTVASAIQKGRVLAVGGCRALGLEDGVKSESLESLAAHARQPLRAAGSRNGDELASRTPSLQRSTKPACEGNPFLHPNFRDIPCSMSLSRAATPHMLHEPHINCIQFLSRRCVKLMNTGYKCTAETSLPDPSQAAAGAFVAGVGAS